MENLIFTKLFLRLFLRKTKQIETTISRKNNPDSCLARPFFKKNDYQTTRSNEKTKVALAWNTDDELNFPKKPVVYL